MIMENGMEGSQDMFLAFHGISLESTLKKRSSQYTVVEETTFLFE